MVGNSANDVPLSEGLVLAAWSAVRATAARMRPTEQAAFSTEKAGRTTPIMTSKPPPSAPSIADLGIDTASAYTGQESLPRSPSPSNRPCTRRPGAFAGTSQIVLRPSADKGREDHTYDVAREADVIQLL